MKVKKVVSLVLLFLMLISSAAFAMPDQTAGKNFDGQKYIDMSKKALAQARERAIMNAENRELPRNLNDNIRPAQKFNPEDRVRVIVELDKRALGAKPSKTGIMALQAQQTDVITQAESHGYLENVRHKFYQGINGFSADISYKNIEGLKKLPGVKKVSIANKYSLDLSTSKQLVSAEKAWTNLGFKGEGMVIAIIDSGIDVNNPDMKISDPNTVKLDQDTVEKLLWQTEIPDVYYNEKVPTGYDWADNDSDVYGYRSAHGMHVAGIAAANGKVKGVAPEAQILAEKVFSDESDYAYSDDIIAGIIHAINFEADVINMSLGASAGFVNPDDPEQKAIKLAVDSGIVVVVSAGNEAYSTSPWDPYAANPDIGVAGSPGVGLDTIQVASYENSRVTGYYLEYGDGQKAMYAQAGPYDPVDVLGEGVEFVDCGLGRVTDFPGDVSRKIALIKRGSITFVEKILNAQHHGAIGVIVFNNEIGGDALVNMMYPTEEMDGEDGAIPAVFIGNTAGKALLDLQEKRVSFNGGTMSAPNPLQGQLSDFTSWGLTPDLEFKPEISAPGGNIWSTVNDGKYESMSGTSMAAPHVAGAAALVSQYLQGNNHDKDRNLVEKAKIMLLNTAEVIVDPNSGLPYSPRRQGAGLMNIYNALQSPVLITGPDGKAAVSLKEITDSTTFFLTATNISDEPITYHVYSSILTNETYDDGIEYLLLQDTEIDGATLTVTEQVYGETVNNFVYLAPGETDLTVELNLPAGFPTERFVEGFIRFVPEDASLPALSVPYVGFYGDWNKPKVVDTGVWDDDPTYLGLTGAYDSWVIWYFQMFGLNPLQLWYFTLGNDLEGNLDPEHIAFSPNGDGYQDEISTAFTLLRNAKNFEMYIEDSNGTTVKPIFDNTTFEAAGEKLFAEGLRKNVMDAGDYVWMDSEAFAWAGEDPTGATVGDGQYFVVLESTIDYPGAAPQRYRIPVKVDTAAPVVANVGWQNNGEGTYQINWQGSDERSGLYGYLVYVDGQMVTVDEEGYAAPIADTQYTLASDTAPQQVVVVAIDFAGNMGVDYTGNPVIVEDEIFEEVTIDGTSISSERPAVIKASTVIPVDWQAEIQDISGQFVEELPTAENSDYYYVEWAPDPNLGSGAYKVVFTVTDEKGNTSKLVREFSIYNFAVKINDVKVLDQSGNLIDSATRNSTIQIEADITNLGPNLVSPMLIVKVTDPAGKVVNISTVKVYDVTAGGTCKATTGFTIAGDWSVGDYKVQIYVWDGWEGMNALSHDDTLILPVK